MDVRFEAEPLPRDPAVIASPETEFGPLTTSTLGVGDDPPKSLAVHVLPGLHWKKLWPAPASRGLDQGDNRAHRHNPLMITAPKIPLAGLTFPPTAQSRIEIWPGALTHIVPISPASRLLGHPAATASPAIAPGIESVRSAEQVFEVISGKSSETEFRK